MCAKNFGTFIEFDRSAFAVEMMFHFLVGKVLLASLTGELNVAEGLKRKSVYFLYWNVFVTAVRTVF